MILLLFPFFIGLFFFAFIVTFMICLFVYPFRKKKIPEEQLLRDRITKLETDKMRLRTALDGTLRRWNWCESQGDGFDAESQKVYNGSRGILNETHY